MNDHTFIVKKIDNNKLNSHDLKKIEAISNRASNKVYGDEIPEKMDKKLIVGITPAQHRAVIKYCTDCKLNGIDKHNNIAKLIRDLLSTFIEENNLKD